MTLYELTNEYLQLLEWAEDPDIDSQVLEDTMEGLEGEIEDKADGYAKVIAQLKSDSAALKAEIDRLTERKRRLDNSVERMKNSLQGAMIATGKTKFKTELFSFNIQKNPPRMVKDVEDWTKYPPEYRIHPDPEVNWAKVKEALKDPEEAIWLGDLVHLEQTEGLRIK